MLGALERVNRWLPSLDGFVLSSEAIADGILDALEERHRKEREMEKHQNPLEILMDRYGEWDGIRAKQALEARIGKANHLYSLISEMAGQLDHDSIEADPVIREGMAEDAMRILQGAWKLRLVMAETYRLSALTACCGALKVFQMHHGKHLVWHLEKSEEYMDGIGDRLGLIT